MNIVYPNSHTGTQFTDPTQTYSDADDRGGIVNGKIKNDVIEYSYPSTSMTGATYIRIVIYVSQFQSYDNDLVTISASTSNGSVDLLASSTPTDATNKCYSAEVALSFFPTANTSDMTLLINDTDVGGGDTVVFTIEANWIEWSTQSIVRANSSAGTPLVNGALGYDGDTETYSTSDFNLGSFTYNFPSTAISSTNLKLSVLINFFCQYIGTDGRMIVTGNGNTVYMFAPSYTGWHGFEKTGDISNLLATNANQVTFTFSRAGSGFTSPSLLHDIFLEYDEPPPEIIVSPSVIAMTMYPKTATVEITQSGRVLYEIDDPMDMSISLKTAIVPQKTLFPAKVPMTITAKTATVEIYPLPLDPLDPVIPDLAHTLDIFGDSNCLHLYTFDNEDIDDYGNATFSNESSTEYYHSGKFGRGISLSGNYWDGCNDAWSTLTISYHVYYHENLIWNFVNTFVPKDGGNNYVSVNWGNNGSIRVYDGTTAQFVSNSKMQKGKWIHVSFQLNIGNSTVDTWVDGQKSTVSPTVSMFASPLRFFQFQGNLYNGDHLAIFDQCRVFNRALTDAERVILSKESTYTHTPQHMRLRPIALTPQVFTEPPPVEISVSPEVLTLIMGFKDPLVTQWKYIPSNVNRFHFAQEVGTTLSRKKVTMMQEVEQTKTHNIIRRVRS